eukprot:763524-Hanusia_phi.AAC.2
MPRYLPLRHYHRPSPAAPAAPAAPTFLTSLLHRLFPPSCASPPLTIASARGSPGQAWRPGRRGRQGGAGKEAPPVAARAGGKVPRQVRGEERGRGSRSAGGRSAAGTRRASPP